MKSPLRYLLGCALLALSTLPTAAQLIPCNIPYPSSLPVEQRAFRENIEHQAQEYIRQQQQRKVAARAQSPGGNNTDPQGIVTPINLTIPVVVHIVRNTSATWTMSDQQVAAQLQVLNNDFNRLNTDKTQTHPDHLSVAASTGISFQLAAFDPKGNCTSGIETVTTSHGVFYYPNEQHQMKSYNDGYGTMPNAGGADTWDASRYMNIWVCDLGGAATGVYGYAAFYPGEPGRNRSAAIDGIVVDYRYFDANHPTSRGRMLTHEAGHYLNLHHIWGDITDGTYVNVGDNCQTDLVDDTPTVQGEPAYNAAGTLVAHQVVYRDCNLHYSDCGNTGTPTLDMGENFMSYAPGSCQNMFTAGQAGRMCSLLLRGGARSGLTNNSPAFYPYPVLSTPVPTSFCVTNQPIRYPITCLPNPSCPGKPAVISYTYKIDATDTDVFFVNNPSSNTYTVPAAGGSHAEVEMKPGNYVKFIYISANYAGGGSSSISLPLRVHKGPPTGTLPSAPIIFQEKDNSCYYSIRVPVLPGVDRYVVNYVVPATGVTGGAAVNIPIDDYVARPNFINALIGIRGGVSAQSLNVTVLAYNGCGGPSVNVGSYTGIIVPAAPAGCYNYTTNRQAPTAATQAAASVVTLYPNPATQEVTLHAALAAGFSSGVIRTTMGYIVKRFSVNVENPTVGLEGLKPGLYIVELQGKAGVERQQLSVGNL